MKRTLITIVVAAFAALSISFAQTAGPVGGAPTTGTGPGAVGGHRGGGGMKRLQEAFAKLNLTDQQKGQIKDIISRAEAAHKDLRAKVKAGTLTKDQAKTEAQAIGKKTHEAVMALLTPQQKRELAAILKEERKNGKGGKGGKPGSPPPPVN